jgi:hypothetical protein
MTRRPTSPNDVEVALVRVVVTRGGVLGLAGVHG